MYINDTTTERVKEGRRGAWYRGKPRTTPLQIYTIVDGISFFFFFFTLIMRKIFSVKEPTQFAPSVRLLYIGSWHYALSCFFFFFVHLYANKITIF